MSVVAVILLYIDSIGITPLRQHPAVPVEDVRWLHSFILARLNQFHLKMPYWYLEGNCFPSCIIHIHGLNVNYLIPLSWKKNCSARCGNFIFFNIQRWDWFHCWLTTILAHPWSQSLEEHMQVSPRDKAKCFPLLINLFNLKFLMYRQTKNNQWCTEINNGHLFLPLKSGGSQMSWHWSCKFLWIPLSTWEGCQCREDSPPWRSKSST